MANNVKGSKRSVEKVLVAANNVSLPTDGVSINGTGGIVNLSDGQIGLLDVTPGSTTFNQFFNNAGNQTFETIPVMKVVQGTNTSANPSTALVPFTRRPYESSVEIMGNQVISYTGKAYAAPYNSATVFGVGTPQSLSKYSVYMGFRGRRVTEFDAGIHAVVKKKVEVTTPDFSVLSPSSDADYLITQIVDAVDRNSAQFNAFYGNFGGNWRVIAFGIDVSGGSGTAISAITAGTSVPTIVSDSGVTLSVSFTQDMVDTLAQVVANTSLTTSSTIELVDLSVAGAGTCDNVLLIAMNEVPAYVDRDPYLKIRIDVGLGDTFQDLNITPTVGSDPFEGQGTYRQWKIYFENTNGQRGYSQNRDLYPILVYPTSLSDTATYAAIILEHYIQNQVQFTGTSVSPHKTIILVPSGSSAKATILAAFNKYLAPKFPPVTI